LLYKNKSFIRKAIDSASRLDVNIEVRKKIFQGKSIKVLNRKDPLENNSKASNKTLKV